MYVLIGLPGSGKSTVGRLLARRLVLPFLDSDHIIEQRLGCSIREYFSREGEERFRDLEQATIHELVQESGAAVLSTGGGAILRAANRECLKATERVVYLHALPGDIFRRLRHDQTRPLLQVADPAARFRTLYAERDPLYREVAQFVIETGRPSVASLVNLVLMQLELAGVIESEGCSKR